MKNETTVGQRVAEEIRVRAFPDSHREELTALGISYDCYSKWRSGKTNPDAYALGKLAGAGYDIAYLLTGEENGELVFPVRCGKCCRRDDKAADGTVYCQKLRRHMPKNGYCSYGQREE